MTNFVGRVGADCERLVGGALAEPINAISSVAFLLAGLWIVNRARRPLGRRTELVAFGLSVSSNALGGIVFHGLRSPGARWIHDVAIASVLLFVAVFVLARVRTHSARWTVLAFAASLALLGFLLAVVPDSTYPLFAVLGVAVGGWELREYRRGYTQVRIEGLTARLAARFGIAGVAGLAATAFFVGRTGAPLCNPGSTFQWHAVWHVLAALAMTLYAYGAIEPHPASAGDARSGITGGGRGVASPAPGSKRARAVRLRSG